MSNFVFLKSIFNHEIHMNIIYKTILYPAKRRVQHLFKFYQGNEESSLYGHLTLLSIYLQILQSPPYFLDIS